MKKKDQEKEVVDDDIYIEECWDKMVDSDEINNGDDGFMMGYLEDNN